MSQLLIGAWFLECHNNHVHKEEKHLIHVGGPSGAGTAAMEIEDHDDDFSILPGAPPPPVAAVAPAPKAKARGNRKRRNNAPDLEPEEQPQSDAEPKSEAPLPNENAGGGEPDLTQTSQGTVVNARIDGAGLTHASQRTTVIARRRGPGLTQGSEGGVSNAGFPPRLYNVGHNSPQSPHRPKQSKFAKRPNPIPKYVGSSSSSAITVSLPMYLEKGDMGHLVHQYTHDGVWEEQIMEIVEHIKKVTTSPIYYNLIL